MSKISGFLALVLVATFSLAYTQANAEYMPGGDTIWEEYSSGGVPTSPYFVLDKHSTNHTYNQLRVYLSFGYYRYLYKMRAGSGGSGTNVAADSMNECNKYVEGADPAPPGGGWLPNGTYTISSYYVYKNDGDIRGPAWYIGSHVCSNGYTVRSALYIHSRSDFVVSNLQHWESYGCIKLSWNDIGVLMDQYVLATRPTRGSGKVIS